MIRLDCSGVRFGSQLDEKHMFTWAAEIPSVVGWEQDILLVRSRNMSEASLRDLIALFWRYDIPMAQLAQFRSSSNARWFASPTMFWHKRVFGRNLTSGSSRRSRLRRARG